jgi:hypothetical protein
MDARVEQMYYSSDLITNGNAGFISIYTEKYVSCPIYLDFAFERSRYISIDLKPCGSATAKAESE